MRINARPGKQAAVKRSDPMSTLPGWRPTNSPITCECRKYVRCGARAHSDGTFIWHVLPHRCHFWFPIFLVRIYFCVILSRLCHINICFIVIHTRNHLPHHSKTPAVASLSRSPIPFADLCAIARAQFQPMRIIEYFWPQSQTKNSDYS